ncbi:MAG: hypothetical protein PHN44_11860 [Candidatus Marinimicrobia bacterium]|nr:hypothetical protein [Candidatus Neomarinimicrobiota bacterium]
MIITDADIVALTHRVIDGVGEINNEAYYKANHTTPEQRSKLALALKKWLSRIGLETETGSGCDPQFQFLN